MNDNVVASRPINILLADDDEEDRMLTREALARHRLANRLQTVDDGEQLLRYLRREPPFTDAPRPDLILLDLNMPRVDGREALRAIKADPALRSIPVVVLTTSSQEEDVFRSYDIGASSYITKPVGFESLVRALGEMGRYWFQVVELPNAPSATTPSRSSTS